MGTDDRETVPETDRLISRKHELRRAMEARRAEAFEKNPQASLALRDVFLASIKLPPSSIIASYYARGSEIDPALLNDALRAAGHRIALPVLEAKDAALVFRIHDKNAPLVPNRFGIPEPDIFAAAVTPDIVLAPLLAFDRRGGRLGTGGGFYDRTLAQLLRHGRVITMGLGFACQEVPAVPLGPHDIALDGIITEIQAFKP